MNSERYIYRNPKEDNYYMIEAITNNGEVIKINEKTSNDTKKWKLNKSYYEKGVDLKETLKSLLEKNNLPIYNILRFNLILKFLN